MAETTSLILHPDEDKVRLGGVVSRTRSLRELGPVESFFNEVMQSYPTVASFDCNADEAHYFWTINYTTFGGCFMMHPLAKYASSIQYRDAAIHGDPDHVDFVGHYVDEIEKQRSNKYVEIKKLSNHKADALVVLTGTNIFDDVVCINKLRNIVENHGKLAVIKPHPLMVDGQVEAIKKLLLPSARILDSKDDMYSYMSQVEKVYTTHSSESALKAVCLDKYIEPIDKYSAAHRGSFAGLNSLLFTTKEPKPLVNRILNSYKSGIIHPQLHKDWQDRIIMYLDYIHGVRELHKNAYL